MRARKCKYVVCLSIILVLYNVIYQLVGVGDYIQARSYEHDFDYPLDVDVKSLVDQILNGAKPSTKPINYYPYKYAMNASEKCSRDDKSRLVILVKSAMNHFVNRDAIRQTWGSTDGAVNATIKVVFFIGISQTLHTNIRSKIEEEALKYRDVVQSDFVDNYFNNTIKTMMSFRWAYQHCPKSDYYLFTDDDMYISVRNLLKYVEDPANYPKSVRKSGDISNELRLGADDEDMYAGYVFKSAPHRHIVSKWRVSLAEYPWDAWPPYATAGAYVISNRAMKYLYLGSLYVKHFRFDDIYLAIVAKRTGITPRHCKEFYFYKKFYKPEIYKYLIASHGYGDQNELIAVWNEQRSLGYA